MLLCELLPTCSLLRRWGFSGFSKTQSRNRLKQIKQVCLSSPATSNICTLACCRSSTTSRLRWLHINTGLLQSANLHAILR